MVMVSCDKYLTLYPKAGEQIREWALDEIGAELKQRGVTLKALMESGRKVRGQLLKEQYGLAKKKVRTKDRV